MALGSNTGMGFLRVGNQQLIQNGDFILDFRLFIKIVGFVICGLQVKCKKNSLMSRGTGFKVLGKLRGPRVHFIALGRMTYSHSRTGSSFNYKIKP